MNAASPAARAVAQSASSAPPSFDGMEWLVAVNLAWTTALFFIFAMLAADMVLQLRRDRRSTDWRHARFRVWARTPATIWRAVGACLGLAGTLRFGTAAAVLWGWNPLDPEMAGRLLWFQRLIDPVGMTLGFAAIALFKLSQRGMLEQLKKKPLPVDMWASLPMLRRPAIIAALSLAAAIGVVTFR